MSDISKYRDEFPIVGNCTFLDHAAVAPISLRARRRMDEWTDDAVNIGRPAVKKWGAVAKSAREAAARLLGCTAGEVAFAGSTSMGLSLFASSLDWRVGDNVVTAANEFPANMYPWLNLKRFGVTVKTVAPAGDGRIPLEDLLAAVDSRTRVVAISWVGFNTGFRIDLSRLGRECRKRGVHLAVDVIQGLGAFPLEAREWNVAAAAADAHKWLLGPEGIALLYVAREVVDSLHPPIVGWKSVVKTGDFLHYDFELTHNARRFEPGSENSAGIHGLLGALELFEEVGMDNVTRAVKLVTDYLVEGLRQKGHRVLNPRGENEWSGIVAFPAPGGDGPAFSKALAEKGIIVTGRADFVRVSPHFYNTREEIDRLLDEL
ncbi:MAG: aminotransferase class V-fold PLP-dependent enzyme [Planctomycetota bacterium]|jgi:selenocysteine lyase/cysteine desulfurase